MATSADTGDVPHTLTHDEALQEDARAYADTYGVTLDEAIRRLIFQNEVDAVIDRAVRLAGPRFAGAWIEHTPEYRAVILLTGTDSAPQISELAFSFPGVTIRLGAKFSHADLLEQRTALARDLTSPLPATGIGVDVAAGLRVDTSIPLSEDERGQLASNGRPPIRFVVHPPLVNQHTWGGRSLGFGNGTCTTGFTAKTLSGIPGVLTAGHCPNPNVTYYQNADVSYPLVVYYEFWDDDEDYQWMKERTQTHVVEPKFYAGGGYNPGYRTVTNPDAPSWDAMVGDWVCHFGRTSGYSCGTITDSSFQPTGPNGQGFCGPNQVQCHSRFVLVERV